ncbi:MAG: RluA family pseudouridine synthase [Thermodesulfovibrionales bacterium]
MSRTCMYTVTEGESGKRIDVAAASLSGISRSQVQRLIQDSRLTVNGRVPRSNEHARAGDIILIETAEEAPVLLPEPLAVPVLYQDDFVIVVDKPHGMVVYPAAGHDRGTLMNAVSSRCPRLASVGGPLRPGVVHRLDKDTSGVMVVALEDRAYYSLVEQFRMRSILRSYLAIVSGRPRQDRGTIDLAIGRSDSDRKKMSTRTRSGKEASTSWEAVERFTAATLIRARLGTGRTHQIRVHFSAVGHPVIGDRTYGRRLSIEIGRRRVPVARQMLHAEILGFRHPDSGRQMEFRSELPGDMADLLRQLRSGSSS